MSSQTDCSSKDPVEECGHFKILIPAYAVGAIIGPKGNTISRLQDVTQTKIEISRVRDYYPGTTERVCLISGRLEAILNVHKIIMETINEKPYKDVWPCIDYASKRVFERKQQVKILIPNKIVSKIIGLGGSTIKDIQEKTGAVVQVSQMSSDVTLYERCVRVMGEIENVHYACRLILEKVVGDEVMTRFLHVSYSNAICSVPNSNPTGPPVAQSREIYNNFRSSGLQVETNFPNVPHSTSPLSTASMYSVDINQLIETVKYMLGNTVSDEGLNDIRNALSTLANYGVLELCLRIMINGSATPFPVLDNLLKEKTSSEDGTNFLPSGLFNNQSMYFHAYPMDPNFVTVPEQMQGKFGPVGHSSEADI